jgi:hypothetical protein
MLLSEQPSPSKGQLNKEALGIGRNGCIGLIIFLYPKDAYVRQS